MTTSEHSSATEALADTEYDDSPRIWLEDLWWIYPGMNIIEELEERLKAMWEACSKDYDKFLSVVLDDGKGFGGEGPDPRHHPDDPVQEVVLYWDHREMLVACRVDGCERWDRREYHWA